MRRIVIAAMSTLSALVLLFSYHTSTGSGTAVASSAPATTGPSDTGSTSATTPTATDATPTDPATSSTTGSSATGAADGTYTGDTVGTRWGDVQVQITVSGGKVTTSEAVVYPQENPRDQEINAYALPILSQAAVAAQSAKIDAVSGATVTSDGYISSLQSALDQAHL